MRARPYGLTFPWGPRILPRDRAGSGRDPCSKWEITVTAPTSSLIIRELKEDFRPRVKAQHRPHDGNLGFESVLKVAREIRVDGRSMARILKGFVL